MSWGANSAPSNGAFSRSIRNNVQEHNELSSSEECLVMYGGASNRDDANSRREDARVCRDDPCGPREDVVGRREDGVGRREESAALNRDEEFVRREDTVGLNRDEVMALNREFENVGVGAPPTSPTEPLPSNHQPNIAHSASGLGNASIRGVDNGIVDCRRIVLGAYSNHPGNGGVIPGGRNVVDAPYQQQEGGASPPLPVIPQGGNSASARSPSSPPSPLATAAPPPTPSAATNNAIPPTGTGPASIPPQNGGPMYNWQATMTTVKERFAFLFNNEILSDVHFLVGSGESRQRIPAHKFVLAVGSAVFDAMFNGQLSVTQEEIELPDVEPQAFLALLRFLYSDEVEIGHETVMTVLYTAKKYAVPALEQACVDFLKRNLSHDNAFMLLTQARLFDEPQLAALCLETIDKNTADSLAAEGFTDIDNNTLCMVLERDTLRIREAKLFQAVVRWSSAECERCPLPLNSSNQRAVLGRGLSLVRFPLMTVEEFAQGPAQSGILTDREVVQLFLHFTVNPKPPVNFLDTPRCCMTGKEQTVCRFQQIESRWGYSGTSDRIRFIVDRRIFVVGFGMYGSIHGPSEYEVTIQIIHTATGKVCASNDTSFTSDGTVNTFRVMFKEPVEVIPNTNYTAYATLKGPDSHYGTKGVRKVVVECPSGDRATFQFTYAAGNNNGTSVEDGQIPEIIFYT